MRVLLASSERLAGCIVHALEKAGHQVTGVISPRRGIFQRQATGLRFRLLDLRGWDVQTVCRKRGIEFRVTHNLSDGAVTAFIKSRKPDLLIVLGWPRLISDNTLKLFPFGGMNIHPSVLPLLRGADPLFAAVDGDLDGFGVTFHKMVSELDAGPIHHQVTIPRAADDNYDDLYFKLINAIHRHVPHAMRCLEQDPAGRPQQGAGGEVKRFRPAQRFADFRWSRKRLYRRSLACHPHHALIAALGGRFFFFTKCKPVSGAGGGSAPPGAVHKVGWFSLEVQAGDGIVRLSGIRFPGIPFCFTPLLLGRYVKVDDLLVTSREARRIFKQQSRA